jgi:hypothetical protein
MSRVSLVEIAAALSSMALTPAFRRSPIDLLKESPNVSVYGNIVTRRLRAMGIRDMTIAPGSPSQDGFA